MRFPHFRFIRPIVLACTLSGAFCSVANGQQPAAGQAGASGTNTAGTTSPSLQPSPMSQLRALEPDPNEEYTLGGGDELSIEVPGRPELSVKVTVGPDGRISLPTAGTVNLTGLTRDQASAAITEAYSKYYKATTASVNIDKYGSNRVMVIGAVEHQGFINFEQTPTLLQAITEAGLPQQTLAESPPSTLRSNSGKPMRSFADSLPEECYVYRGPAGNQTVYTVHVRDLLSTGNAMADVRLRRNDMIVVPDQQDRFVSVQGEVKTPGLILLRYNSTLPSVLAQAGGLTENAGNARIQIVDPATGVTRYVKFEELLTPKGVNEVALKPGELIYVPKRGIAKMGYVFQQLSPITSVASIAAIAAQ